MRVLFTCLPGFGHFNPLVPLARALGRAGHEVAFSTAEEFCPRVVRAGFTAFPSGLTLSQQMDEARARFPDHHALPPGKERFETFVPRMLAGVAAPARLDDLVPVVKDWRPELVVHDEAELAAPVAAEVAGVPHAAHSVVLVRPWAMIRLQGAILAPLAARWGVDLDPYGGLYRHLYLYACPRSLQPEHLDEVPAARPIRSIDDLDTAAGEALPAWAEGLSPAPTVYVTLGTAFGRNRDVFAAVLEGLRDERLNVVGTVGYDADPASFGPQPPHVHLERYVPLTLLLPRLDVVVSQGGTSILPTLGRGIPLLLLPQAADQFHNAEACVERGVGRRLLPGEVSPEAVRTEVHRLLVDPSFRRRAEEVRAEFEDMPAPDQVVGRLERLVADRRPSPP